MPTDDVGSAALRSKRASGPLTARPPTSGETPTTGPRRCASARRTPGTARIGPMLKNGLLGAMMTALAPRIAERTPGPGRARAAPSIADASHGRARVVPHQVALEGKSARGGLEYGPHGVIGHREHPRPYPEALADLGCDGRECGAACQTLGAVEVCREVAVSKAKPRRSIEATERAEAGERITPDAPAGTRIGDTRERIADGVEVRGDGEPEESLVVSGVDDDGERGRISNADQAAQESRGADSARQHRQRRSRSHQGRSPRNRRASCRGLCARPVAGRPR